MAWLNDLGNGLGFGDLDRGQNEFRDVNQGNFNLPGYRQREDRLLGQGDAFLGRAAPTAADSNFRTDQAYALERLRHLSTGADSLIAEQGAAANAALGAQQRQYAAGAAPANAAMAQRIASRNMALGGMGIDANTRMGQMQERQAALAGLGQLAGQARGQDIGLNQFNVGANLQQQGLNQQGWLGAQGLEAQNAAQQQAGMMGYENQRGQRFAGLLGNPTTGERALGAAVGIGTLIATKGQKGGSGQGGG